jgi:hypothetical protein
MAVCQFKCSLPQKDCKDVVLNINKEMPGVIQMKEMMHWASFQNGIAVLNR